MLRMSNLLREFEELKKKTFKLDFTYPDNGLLSKLRVVHRDLSSQEKQKPEKKTVSQPNLWRRWIKVMLTIGRS